MKKIKSLRIASILLIATLLSMCLLGGTFAKYTTEGSGSSTTTVARWSFSANDTDIAVTPTNTVKFNPFDSIYDLATGSEKDSDVKSKKLAPGSGGRCELKVENNADVSAKYSIAFSETNDSNIPLQYSLDGETWYDSIAELSTESITDQIINLTDTVQTRKHTLYWRWAFDGKESGTHNGQTDKTDTTLGVDAESATVPTIVISATITASQVD